MPERTRELPAVPDNASEKRKKILVSVGASAAAVGLVAAGFAAGRATAPEESRGHNVNIESLRPTPELEASIAPTPARSAEQAMPSPDEASPSDLSSMPSDEATRAILDKYFEFDVHPKDLDKSNFDNSATVDGDQINVFSSPNTNSEVVASFEHGDQVALVCAEEDGQWVKKMEDSSRLRSDIWYGLDLDQSGGAPDAYVSRTDGSLNGVNHSQIAPC